jgi:hypothetical protein
MKPKKMNKREREQIERLAEVFLSGKDQNGQKKVVLIETPINKSRKGFVLSSDWVNPTYYFMPPKVTGATEMWLSDLAGQMSDN